MTDIFIRMVLGHLVGDYLLQSESMGIKKGYLHIYCLIHCLIYTLTVCLFMWNFHPLIMVLVFLSHYPIDKWSLGLLWLRLINGRDYWKEFNNKKDEYRDLKLPFSCFVYVAADNTIHIVLLWLISLLV